jgi:deoxyribodipyrimidine photo-lyase
MSASDKALVDQPVVIHWFRRDLRLDDNTALMRACADGRAVLPIFIFDTNILDKLKLRNDARVTFIHRQLQAIDGTLRSQNGALRVFHGTPEVVFEQLFATHRVEAVYCNEDYEPYARRRDDRIQTLCSAHEVKFHKFKDHVIFAPHEVVKEDGNPYQIYTPYARRWLERFEIERPPVAPKILKSAYASADAAHQNPSLTELGFQENSLQLPGKEFDQNLIGHYDETRDIPGIAGTSRLGLHLRFGTISIRSLAHIAHGLNIKFLKELIWREFYQMILWFYPETIKLAFRENYRKLKFPGTQADFRKWASAETGYPLVDAGIRELVSTGFMHNRVRMVAASFLTKHLLCDWRWGEHFFAQHLLDFELASNVGGWQWSAGIGADAAPYFRIFNPSEQAKKFDPDGSYMRHWLDEGNFFGTPRATPMVDHRFARERCLNFFSAARR